jgi:hypothetical protein
MCPPDGTAATGGQLGRVLNGRYRLDRILGRGGFAQVFLATDLALQRPVAVKVLHAALTEDQGQDFLARFAQEARAVAALDHPNILSIHDYGEAAGTVYLVMPYVDGGTLHNLLRAGDGNGADGRVSPADAGRYVRQVAAALDYAHRRKLVHRDIKPQNMLIRSEDRHLLLADFGIAKVLTGTEAQSRTGVLGTLAYMAPEQFEGIVSPASDIYALGCVLCQLLTGTVPYSGTTEQVIFAHLQHPAPRLAGYGIAGLPPALQGVLDRALAKRPEERYAAAGDLAVAYDAALAGTDRSYATGAAATVVGAATIVGHSTSPHDPGATLLGVAPSATDGPADFPPPGGTQYPPLGVVPVAGYSSQPPPSPPARPTGGRRAFLAGVVGLGTVALLAAAGGGALAARSRGGAAATATPASRATIAANVGQVSARPSAVPSVAPIAPPAPTVAPTTAPTAIPAAAATVTPSAAAVAPSAAPSAVPTALPSASAAPAIPTAAPSVPPAVAPAPSNAPAAGGFGGAAGQVLRGHAELVEAVAFAPDGTLLASGADDNTARLWRPDGQGVAILTGHSADINGVAWSPDGTFVSTASGDGTLRTWVSDGVLASTLKGHTDVVMGAAWLADSVSLVSASWDGTLRLWHAVRAENTRTIAAHNAKIWAIALSAEKVIASGSEDATIRLWGLDGAAKGTLRGHTDVIWGLSYSPDGAFLASGSKDGTVRLWDRAGNAVRTVLSGLPPVASVAWSRNDDPNGGLIAAGLYDGRIVVAAPTGRVVATCAGHGGYVAGLAWHPRSAILASASQDATIRIWS